FKIYEIIETWKKNTDFLSEFLKYDEEMAIKNINYNIDGNTIHSSQFIGYINQKQNKSLDTCEFISDNNIHIKSIENEFNKVI
ncbi:2146_t:CDS:1, partial [Cetraspora pellucida]